jgi:type I restriction enzyme S subunit
MGLHQGLRIAQARRDLAFNQDVKALVAKEVDPVFLLLGLLTAESELFNRVKPAGHGTGVLETEALRDVKLHCPPAEVALAFIAILDGLNDRIAVSREETLTLAALRDTMLPKLISGALRLTDARTFLERVL